MMFLGDNNVLSNRLLGCLTNKRNRKTILSIAISAILIWAVFSVLIHFGFQKSNTPKQVTAKDGVIDLSEWDYKIDEAVKLIGNWEFYWNELLTLKQIESNAFEEKVPTTTVPGLWKNTFVKGKKLTNEGYATYRLLIKMDSLPENLAVNVKFFISSCKIWVDDKIIYEAGSVGKNVDAFEGKFNPQIIEIHPNNKNFNITVQISNYGYANGGFASSIELGDTMQLISKKYSRAFTDMFLFGAIMIMALYHLALFVFRRKEYYTLYFGIMCLLISIRVLLMGEMLLYNFLPNISLNILLKVSGIVFPLILPCFIMFIHSFFREDTPLWFVRLAQSIGLLFSIITIVLPNNLRYNFLFPFQVCSVIIIIILLVVIAEAAYKRRDGALVFFIATTSITLIILNDILNGYGILITGYYIPIGQLLFIFVQAFMLFRKLVKQEELLIKSELRMLQAQIKPHFLFNALNTIISVSRTSSEKAIELLLYLSDFLRCGFSFKSDEEFVDFEREIIHVKSYLEIEKARFLDRLDVIFDVDSSINCKVPACIIQPIVENAVRHGILPRKDGGTVKLSAKQQENILLISIEDDGVGMTTEKINSVLSGADKSTGIGVANVKERIHRIYKTKISIQSVQEKGTVVSITIPLNKKGESIT